MKPEEAKDILSDMRDRHLCFLGDSEIKEEWQKEYLKESWACDFGAKALEKQIPMKVEEEKWIDTKCICGHVFSKHYGDGYHDIPLQNKTAYRPECGQKLDWGEEGEINEVKECNAD